MKKSIFILFLTAVTIPVHTLAQRLKGTMLVGKVSNEQFGRNVKISGDGTVLAVGAPFNSEHGEKLGRIAVYKFDNNHWEMMGYEILPGVKDFEYGEMMELSEDGKKIIAASPFGGISSYVYDGKGWIKLPQTIQLENKDDQIKSMSITPDAGTMAVAYFSEKYRTVCLRFFNFDGDQWMQDGVDLRPRSDEKIYNFALSLSTDGQLLVVGNYSRDIKEKQNAGEVIFYRKDGNQWVLNGRSFFGDAPNSNLGSAVAVSKDLVIASSSSIDLLDRNTGFVETYEFIGDTWVKQIKSLRPEKQHSYFGHAIAISADGNTMALSMPYLGFGKPGYVQVYEKTATSWKQIAEITDVEGIETTSTPNNTTGWSIALSSDGQSLAIGFPHNDENGDMSGKVLVYDLTYLK